MKHFNLLNSVKIPAALVAASVALTACVSPVAGPSGRYAAPIGSAPVTANPTNYSAGLVCLANYARAKGINGPRIAVGRISDYTGKEEAEGGRKVTQGASLMAISALAKSGAHLVERFDTSVSELELKYANNKLIGDDDAVPTNYRRIMAGQVEGSDFYLVGGITELNYNIRSSGADATIGDIDPKDAKGSFRARAYVMNVGLDLRLVNTKTLEVVDVISYQKQIIGREIGLGIFDFLNGNVFDISAGEGALEPVQLAVRSVIERAVVEMMANMYGVPNSDVCNETLAATTSGLTGSFISMPGAATTGAVRAAPNTWNAARDDSAGKALRGRYSE